MWSVKVYIFFIYSFKLIINLYFLKVRTDLNGVVQVYQPLDDSWSILCANNEFNSSDADRICINFGFLKANNYSLLKIDPFNTSWVIDLPDAKENYTPIHSPACDTNKTVSVVCQQFQCGRGVRESNNETSINPSEDIPPGAIIMSASGAEVKECSAQIISPKWLLTSASCVK